MSIIEKLAKEDDTHIYCYKQGAFWLCYEQLPVYKASYALFLQLFQISKNMERDYKFTLGERISFIPWFIKAL